ncbi:MAG: hypothetical protein IJ644_08465 [Oscillospiraceae bacterium]|nr:hypothetical protein [Oscillospiraceae bacterium]
MADKKKSFILYLDRKKELDMLSDEQAGKIFKAVYQYAEDGTESEFDELVLNVIFSVFRSQIDMNAEKYAEICKKRAEYGKKGGAPKGNQNASKKEESDKTSISLYEQANQPDNENANENDNDNENANENVNANVNENVNDNDIFSSGDTPEPPESVTAQKENFDFSEQDFSHLVEKYTQNPELQQALSDFIDYRKKGRKKFTLKAMELNLEKLDEIASDDREKIAVLKQSLAFGWSGLFPVRNQPNYYGKKRPVHDIIREQEMEDIHKYLDLLD